MNFDEIKLKLITLAEQDDDIELLWLYGSYAKGTAHEKSDIDLAINFKLWLDDVIERRLRSELLAIEWQKNSICKKVN